jgi:phage baseplate assembly protein W
LRWEPRIKLTQVNIYRTTVPGRVVLELKGKLVQDSLPLSMRVSLNIKGAA